METLLIVFLTVIITIVFVLLVEAVFLAILVRLKTVGLHMGRQQCPCSRTKHTERCSSQVATATCNGQTNAARSEDINLGVDKSQESHVDVVDETPSTSHQHHHHFTGSDSQLAAAGAAESSTDGRPTSAEADDQRTTTVMRKPQDHQPTVDCQQLSPNRPCSCWTTVSSDIKFENADDGMVVYHQAKMTVPSSCRCLPKIDDTTPDSVTLQAECSETVREESSPISGTSTTQCQDPWLRDSYVEYIPHSSVFSEDSTSQRSGYNTVRGLQVFNFKGVVRSTHQPTGQGSGLNVAHAVSTHL